MICIGCNAEIVTGPTNECRVTYYARGAARTVIEVRCEECARELAMACWDEEERGPYPLMPIGVAGHA